MRLSVTGSPHLGWGPWEAPMLSYVAKFPSFWGWKCSTIRMDHTLFIHSAINGNLGCLHLLATVNNAALNMSVQISLWDPALKFILGGIYIQKWDLDHMVILFAVFWGTTILLFIEASPFYIPTNTTQGSRFCISLSILVIFFFF